MAVTIVPCPLSPVPCPLSSVLCPLSERDMEDYYLASGVLERVHKGQEAEHSAADVRRELR